MIRTLFIVLLLLFVTLGEAKKSFLSFLNIEKTEILLVTKTKETLVVRSSYRDKQPNSSYLFVKSEDPEILQVVNVTKTSSDVTNFTINIVTDKEGETNLTIQLWETEALDEDLLDCVGPVYNTVTAKSEH
ncbi:sodium/bile acid cotransporter 5 [Tupaia chinensis]|uniref:sodium/bile acid cotransporter 5 n=1 Tax=Tupaia chinensis TaxID=246437 RepID=UPI000FFB4AEF|nr:sodium/bile acid cotransporter 5 [Tupaia chinensis]